MKAEIEAYLKLIEDGLKSEQLRLGMRRSGRSAKSLRTKSDDKRGELIGLAYFEQQIFGRGPTKSGPPPGKGKLRRQIRDWIKDVPELNSLPSLEKERAIINITRAIHRRGTRRGRDPKYPGINLLKIANKHLPNFTARIALQKQRGVLERIRPILKTIP